MMFFLGIFLGLLINYLILVQNYSLVVINILLLFILLTFLIFFKFIFIYINKFDDQYKTDKSLYMKKILKYSLILIILVFLIFNCLILMMKLV